MSADIYLACVNRAFMSGHEMVTTACDFTVSFSDSGSNLCDTKANFKTKTKRLLKTKTKR